MASTAIGFWGGMALLISSITGPGLTTIPLLFQEAGWFTPTIAFLLFGVLSGLVSLFLVETMSNINGNEAFQARVEYSTVAHLYLGEKSHIVMQALLYCALQSVNISSIIISEQTMDSLLIRLFHKTCALSFTEGWICVSEINPSGSPFNSYILFSFGYLISACMVLPLSVMSLVENIKFQLASVATLFFVMIVWVYIFARHGLDLGIPVVGNNQSALVGFVLSNFAFITTVPSFINELSRQVPIHKTIVYPIVVCVAVYIIIGLTGAASFQISQSSDILATLSASSQNKVLVTMVNILFPIAVLVTSVPVFAIVIRYNLVRGDFCSNRYAIMWGSFMPWIFIIPFQTKGWLILVMNWTSLIFGSSTNFIIPLVLYITSKIYPASTADAAGGDVFVLHRDNSLASTHSRQRSTYSTYRGFGVEGIPRLTTTPAEDTELNHNDPPSPLLVVHSPSLSSRRGSLVNAEYPTKKPDEETDVTDIRQEGPVSALDPSSIPLRVVYSPAVSRASSIGHGSHRQTPSLVLNTDTDLGNYQQILPADDVSTPVPSFEVPLSPERHAYRRSRHSSTASNMEGRPPPGNLLNRTFGSTSSHRTTPVTIRDQEEGYQESRATFRAFPERKYFRSIVVAKIALGIVTCCVLGNLIYAIIESARGNSPL